MTSRLQAWEFQSAMSTTGNSSRGYALSVAMPQALRLRANYFSWL
ncbi:hypothetical protein ACEYW6_22240 [Nostoc sp. UIC 10607]